MSRPPLPPFTRETAAQKARMAEDAWNSRNPERVALAYTEDSVWRNRAEFFRGREAIKAFLTRKWTKELDDRRAAFEEFGTVTPAAVLGIGQRHSYGVARIPGVLGHARLLGCGFAGEGRQRRTRHGISPGDVIPRDCTDRYRESTGKLFRREIGLHQKS